MMPKDVSPSDVWMTEHFKQAFLFYYFSVFYFLCVCEQNGDISPRILSWSDQTQNENAANFQFGFHFSEFAIEKF